MTSPRNPGGSARGPFALFLILALVAAGPALAKKKDKRSKRDVAEEQRDDSAWRDAEKEFKFGYQWFQQGLLSQARTHLERALELQPTYDEALYVLALVHYELNDFNRCIRLCDDALGRNPFFTEAWNVKGMALAELGRWQEALKAFEAVKADVSFPTPEIASFNIARVLAQTGRCAEAVPHYEKAIALNPEFGMAYFQLADCQQVIGLQGQSRLSYEKAVEFLPDDANAWYQLGYACFQLGDANCARQALDKVRFMSPGSDLAEGARQLLEKIHFGN